MEPWLVSASVIDSADPFYFALIVSGSTLAFILLAALGRGLGVASSLVEDGMPWSWRHFALTFPYLCFGTLMAVEGAAGLAGHEAVQALEAEWPRGGAVLIYLGGLGIGAMASVAALASTRLVLEGVRDVRSIRQRRRARRAAEGGQET